MKTTNQAQIVVGIVVVFLAGMIAALLIMEQCDTPKKQSISRQCARLEGHSTSLSPVLTRCGESPTVVGNDLMMRVTVGANATGCEITFYEPFDETPCYWLSPEDGRYGPAWITSTTRIVLTNVTPNASYMLAAHKDPR